MVRCFSRLRLLTAFLAPAALLGSLSVAQAQVPLPANLISPDVPHDVAAGQNASIQQLAIFAWQEFIALNWPSVNPATTGQRGRADTTANFLTIAPDQNGSYPLLVWQTYRHKNELFPADGMTDKSFDSKQPTYKYMGGPFSPANGASWNAVQQSRQIKPDRLVQHVRA